MTLIHSGSASLVSFSALRTSQGFQCVSSPGSWVAHTPATIQGWHPDAARVGHLPLELSGLPEVAKKSVPNAERREGLGDVPVIAPRGAGASVRGQSLALHGTHGDRGGCSSSSPLKCLLLHPRSVSLCIEPHPYLIWLRRIQSVRITDEKRSEASQAVS